MSRSKEPEFASIYANYLQEYSTVCLHYQKIPPNIPYLVPSQETKKELMKNTRSNEPPKINRFYFTQKVTQHFIVLWLITTSFPKIHLYVK